MMQVTTFPSIALVDRTTLPDIAHRCEYDRLDP
jgi:hypothetical protein